MPQSSAEPPASTGLAVPTRLAVFGGSGRTGGELIAQALTQGFELRALVRPGHRLVEPRSSVETIEGELDDAAAAARTVRGADAVCCLFGPRPPWDEVFCADATATVVAAMRAEGVRRLACVTGALVGRYRANRTLPFELLARHLRRRHPELLADRERQEEAVRGSGLEWTLFKPPRLRSGSRSHHLDAGPGVKVGLLSVVARSDLAAVILQDLVSPHFAGDAVFLRG